MEHETTNLFRRRDTFLGICEGLGQDFGFNPLWMRLALVAPLFFFPVQTIAAYLGLGLIVLGSRLIFPTKIASPAAPALHVASSDEPVADKAEAFALAA